MKISHFVVPFIVPFFLCALIFSCTKSDKVPAVQPPGTFSREGFRGTASAGYWTPVPEGNFAEMKKLLESANGKLPLSSILSNSYTGKNSDLMHVGHLETQTGGNPGKEDIDRFMAFVNDKANKNNEADFDSGIQGNLPYWVLRMKTTDFYLMKLVFLGDKAKKPLFIDIYVPTANFTEDASAEYERVLNSISSE